MSAEQRYTEGPWCMDEDGDVQSSSGVVVCLMTDGSPERHEGDANARLIAAAPDLLAALRKAERELAAAEHGSVGGVPNTVALLIPEALESVRAAVAKATGGSDV